MKCIFCEPPKIVPGTVEIIVEAKDLCPEHEAMMAKVAEGRRLHEEHGGCYEGCGCISQAELEAKYGLDATEPHPAAPSADGRELGDG